MIVVVLITSIGVAGIPAAYLILDMCRISLNVFSDSCGAVIIVRLEGEERVLTMDGKRQEGRVIRKTDLFQA